MKDLRQQNHAGKVRTGIRAVLQMPAVQRVLTNAGAPIQQVGAIVMETTSALAVVPAGQVDTAGVVVALDQALCTLVDIWGQTCRNQNQNPKQRARSCQQPPNVCGEKREKEDCCTLYSAPDAPHNVFSARDRVLNLLVGRIISWPCFCVFFPPHTFCWFCLAHLVSGMQYAYARPARRREVVTLPPETKSLSSIMYGPTWLLICSFPTPGRKSPIAAHPCGYGATFSHIDASCIGKTQNRQGTVISLSKRRKTTSATQGISLEPLMEFNWGVLLIFPL